MSVCREHELANTLYIKMPLHNRCDFKLLIIFYACISFFGLLTEEGGTLEPSNILNEKIVPLNYKKYSAIFMVFI